MVLARRLWPRAIVQPPLTEADRASMALQALQNQRRPEQHIEVTFDDRESGAEAPARTPQTPDEVAPPADLRVPGPRGQAKPAQAATGCSEAASRRSWAQVALPVTTTTRPAAPVK